MDLILYKVLAGTALGISNPKLDYEMIKTLLV